MSNRLNKQDLATKLVDQGVTDTKKAAVEMIDALVDTIQSSVVAGDTIAIPDFGKFERYERLNGALKPKFTAFSSFKDAVADV